MAGVTGTGLRLRLNGAEELAVAADGAFRFQTPVASGTAYQVVVAAAPAAPAQDCAVANAQGTVGSVAVDDVAVSCATPITVANYQAVAALGNAVAESSLQLAEFVGLRLSWFAARLAPSATESCTWPGVFEPGSVAYEFADRDGSVSLTAGDVVTMTLRDCYSGVLGGTESGRIEATLQPPPQPVDYRVGFAATLRLTGFRLNGALLDGTLDVQYSDRDERRALAAEVSAAALTLTRSSPADTVRVRSARLAKTLDYIAARYTLQLAADFDSATLRGRFALATPTPLAGLFAVFPDAGAQELRSGASVLRISARDIARNRVPDTVLARDSSTPPAPVPQSSWTGYTRGFLWWEARRGQSSGGTEFDGAGVVDRAQWVRALMFYEPVADATNGIIGESLPVGTPIKLFFSAPIDATRTRLSFVPPGFPPGLATIPARLAVNGAFVTATGERQLEHGIQYALDGQGSVYYLPGGIPSTGFPWLRLTTRNNLQADPAPSPAVTAPGGTVALRSARSFSTEGPIANTRWAQTSGPAVALAGAGTPTASFVVPAGTADGQSLRFRLTIENSAAESDSTETTVFVLSNPLRPFFTSRRSQSAAQGVTAEGARLHSDLDGPVSASFLGTSQFQFQIPPSGSAPRTTVQFWSGAAPLAPGTFTVGTPSTRVVAPDMPPCNDPPGQFVVRDLERGPANEVVRFAADYEISCGPREPVYTGSVRVNSAVPLP